MLLLLPAVLCFAVVTNVNDNFTDYPAFMCCVKIHLMECIHAVVEWVKFRFYFFALFLYVLFYGYGCVCVPRFSGHL